MKNPWRRPRRSRAVLTGAVLCVATAAGIFAISHTRHGLAAIARASAGASAAPVPSVAPTTSPVAASGAQPVVPLAGPIPPGLAAQADELLDVRSGTVLAEHNANVQIAPASLAKMMTFDLTLQALSAGQVQLDTAIPLGPGVRRLSTTPGLSNMYLDLPPGTTVPLRTLMLGMMVASGNDAALAVAEDLGGTEAHFVAMMNAEAGKLGMARTHFENPEGLAATGQVTTAADMAILARHIWLRYPDLYGQFTDVASFTWKGTTFRNYNRLIGADPAVTGMKSGYWGGVGYHLVTTAEQGNTELVGVVMGTSGLQTSATISQTLLDWGFTHFRDVSIPWRKSVV